MRKASLTIRGAKIGKSVYLPHVITTWPHQVEIGNCCILQPDIFFNYDHYWTPGPSIILGDRVFVGRGVEFNIRRRIQIGNDSLIASGCKFIDHDHGRDLNSLVNLQDCIAASITIGANVWIGTNSVILKGVVIGDNAVIGACSVVTKSIPNGETWVGVPAKRI